jgi:hypothetical protein
MAVCYHPSDERPADDPVVLLNLGFLQTQYNFYACEVLAAAQGNLAFRYFLNLALTDSLPHRSLLTVFCARLVASLHQQIFDGVVAQARAPRWSKIIAVQERQPRHRQYRDLFHHPPDRPDSAVRSNTTEQARSGCKVSAWTDCVVREQPVVKRRPVVPCLASLSSG